VRYWEWDRPGSLKDFVTRVNEIRRENPALQYDDRLRFYSADNDRVLCYGKTAPDLANVVVVVVNLDPHHLQRGQVCLPLAELGLGPSAPYQVHDLLSDARFLWQGECNRVEIDPGICPAFIFRLRRKIKTERDFDYYF
jgi:starch synthase (maltosyl-transferring)